MPRLPPSVLCIEGSLKGTAYADLLGFYKLEPGRKVNGRPVWRHTLDAKTFIAFSSDQSWVVQSDKDLGSEDCFMYSASPSFFPCDADAGVWSWSRDGKTTDADATIKCVEAELPSPPPVLLLEGNGLGLSARDLGGVDLKAVNETRTRN